MSAAPTITEIDGVEVHWRALPGRLRADLVFRAGAVDEAFHTLGTGHLVEHLAFVEVEDLDPDVNGSSGMLTTTFQVEGTPEKVARQLRSLCQGISELADGSLPSARIEHEKRILAAEGDVSALGEPAVAEALTVRYGLRGPGLAGVSSRFIEKLTDAEIRSFAREYFTRGNALLVLTGEPPAGLQLPLPEGARRSVPEFDPVPLVLPGEYTTGGEDLVLSFQVPGMSAEVDPVARLVLGTLRRRTFRQLRRDAGVVYDIEAGQALQPRSGVAVIIVRTAQSSLRQAAEGILGILRELRDHGVTDADRQAAHQEVQDQLEDPHHETVELFEAAEAAFLQAPQPALEDLGAAVRAVTDEDVRAWLADLDSTLAVGVPDQDHAEEPEPGTPGLVAPVMGPQPGPDVTGTVYPVKLFARLAGAPKGLKLIVGDDGVLITDGQFRRSLAWDQVAAVEQDASDPDDVQTTIAGLNGEVIEVPTVALKGGDRAVDQICQHVPPRRQITTRPRDDRAEHSGQEPA
ncbi:insulinase family protein [uncultured Citricoccus sp.]|uniref:insulinase family protein n=1 Tax=uncultured Citricoccus sp. TaxID=614031 RepID=UPI002623F84C|nr:insulinase family protein [uncultured Citricoccus sp.]